MRRRPWTSARSIWSAAQIGELEVAGIDNSVVDDHPFQNGDYVVTSTIKPKTDIGMLELTADRIDQLGDALVWKSQTPTVATAQDLADGPMRITGATIPLVYRDAVTQSLAAAFTDPWLDSIAARMSLDSIIAYDTYLMNLQTRYIYTAENDVAQEYIRQKFLSFGYTDVVTDTFNYSGWNAHNVICTKTGTAEPDRVIVIGAHYDSFNQQSDPMVFAPGADDNGSGTVSVMEIARALAGIPTDKTIVFVAFDAEEVGLVGSAVFANRALTDGMDIELMLNMDMIGYDPNNTDLAFFSTEPVSEAYADLAVEMSMQYTGIIGIKNTSPGGSSDHVPFSQAGYNILYAEEYDFNTPGWHTDIDLISRMDMPYLTNVAKTMGLAAYAVSVAPSPVSGLTLWDVGDGNRLPSPTSHNVSPETGDGATLTAYAASPIVLATLVRYGMSMREMRSISVCHPGVLKSYSSA